MGRREVLTIVALGDSLTVGFQSPTPDTPNPHYTPYTRLMPKMIDSLLRSLGAFNLLEVKIHNRGITGDLTSSMLKRFNRDVVSLKPSYVIILGGSNDIGWNISPEDIMINLTRMYEHALDESIEPIACTIPSILGYEPLIPPRIELNIMIKDYCMWKALSCVDLFTATCDPETKRLRIEYSNDGLHLNSEGYRKIAEVVFEDAVKAKIVSKLMSLKQADSPLTI